MCFGFVSRGYTCAETCSQTDASFFQRKLTYRVRSFQGCHIHQHHPGLMCDPLSMYCCYGRRCCCCCLTCRGCCCCCLLLPAAALLAALSENPGMKEFLTYGWEPQSELCNGPQSIETLWTGIECVDPEARPGRVSKM